MQGLPNQVPILTEFSMVLLECRRRSLPFDVAWKRAMKVVRIERDNMDEETCEEMKMWRRALTWAREHFEASYEPNVVLAREADEGTSPSRSRALSRSHSAGDVSRVHAH